MSEAEVRKGYEFSEDQTSLMQAAAKRLRSITRVKLDLFSQTVQEDQVFELRINDAALGIDRELLTIQSMLVSGGPPVFAVFDFGRRQVGPKPVYLSFVEALMHAESFAAAVIESCKEQQAATTAKGAPAKTPSESPAKAGPAYRDYGPTEKVKTSAKRSFTSGMLTEGEIELINSFARGIGNASGCQGFAKYMEAKIGVLSVALGIIGPDETPVMFGTLVVVATTSSSYECSVKGFDGSHVPGPDTYPDVTAALVAVQPYFRHMATQVGVTLKKSQKAKAGPARIIGAVVLVGISLGMFPFDTHALGSTGGQVLAAMCAALFFFAYRLISKGGRSAGGG